jgi:hypothetical protein
MMRIDLGKLTEKEIFELSKECFNNLTEESQIEFLRYAKEQVGKDLIQDVLDETDEGDA